MNTSLVATHLRRTLLAAASASMLVACGGSGDSGGSGPLPPPPVIINGPTYDVVPLNFGKPQTGLVSRQGINAFGQVTGQIEGPNGTVRAFVYDGTRMIDTGTFGGPNAEGFGINRCGKAVGWAEDASGILHGFVFDGALHDTGALAPGRGTEAHAINDCDTVVGWSGAPGSGAHAFFSRNGAAPVDMGTFGGSLSFALAINAHGVATGYAYTAGNAVSYAFVYDTTKGGPLVKIDGLGGNRALAQAINDAGMVVGFARNADDVARAFLYDGTTHDLGAFTPKGNSVANDINAAGLVVGDADSPDGQRAFLYDGTLHNLGSLTGTFSEALAINNSNVVVGSSIAADGEQHAISWTQAEGMVDLNTRLHAPPAGLVLYRALAISDNGSIVANTSTRELVLLKVHR